MSDGATAWELFNGIGALIILLLLVFKPTYGYYAIGGLAVVGVGIAFLVMLAPLLLAPIVFILVVGFLILFPILVFAED